MVQLSQQTHKTRNTYIILGIAILLFVFGCHQMREKQKLKAQQSNTIDFLQDTISYYENSKGERVATINALAGDNNQLKILLSKAIDSTQELAELVKYYKTVNSAGIINTITKIDTVYVTFNQPVGLDFARNINITDDHYRLNAIVNQDGFTLNSLQIPNKMSFVIGKRKNGWFKKPTYQIDVKHSNPYISTQGIDSYTLEPSIKRWSLGPYVGYDPFVQQVSAGISLQYSLIRF